MLTSVYTLKHSSITSLISAKALTTVNSKQLSNKIKSILELSAQTRQASAQETPTASGANNDQEDLAITIKKIIKEV